MYNKKDKLNKQVVRFGGILECWKLALSEKRETIVLMDDNIDSNPEAKHNKIYKIIKLFNMLNDHIVENNIVRHNKKNTRYTPHQPPSSINHIYSNCPQKIYNVETCVNSFSDHSIVSCVYKTKNIVYSPKFILVKNKKLLSKTKKFKCIYESSELELY